MKGLVYESVLTYTYPQNYDQQLMKSLLEVTCPKYIQAKLFETEKIIQYQINHQYQISLKDLLYLLEQKFIKMRLYQLLQLISQIINTFIQTIKFQQIKHGYLGLDRIILDLTGQEKQFSITFVDHLYFQIFFVGFGSSNYEQKSYLKPQNDEESIKYIISYMLSNMSKYIKKNVLKNANLLIDNLQKDLQQLSIQEFKNKLDKKLKEKRVANKQILNNIDEENILQSIAKRAQRQNDVQKNLYDMVTTIKNFKSRININCQESNISYFLIKMTIMLNITILKKKFSINILSSYEPLIIKNEILYEMEKNDLQNLIKFNKQEIELQMQKFQTFLKTQYKFNIDQQKINDKIDQQLQQQQLKLEQVLNDTYDDQRMYQIQLFIQQEKQQILKEVVKKVYEEELAFQLINFFIDLY